MLLLAWIESELDACKGVEMLLTAGITGGDACDVDPGAEPIMALRFGEACSCERREATEREENEGPGGAGFASNDSEAVGVEATGPIDCVLYPFS